MIDRTPRHDQDIRLLANEIMRQNDSKGIGVIVVNWENFDQILVGQERFPKVVNGEVFKRAGETSIPIETRKFGETPFSNAQAALIEEVFSDVPDSFLQNHFLFHESLSFSQRGIAFRGTQDQFADLLTVIYTGPAELPISENNDLANPHWVRISEVTNGHWDQVRRVAQTGIQQFLMEGFPVISAYASHELTQNRVPSPFLPLYSRGFNRNAFLQRRSTRHDVAL
jgi:hypothetical protein